MADAAKNSGEVSDSAAGEKVLIHIRTPNGSNFTVRTELESTVGEFKTLLAQNSDIPANQQRLIHKGRILKDDQTLVSCGLQDEQAVHLIRLFVSIAPNAATHGPRGRNTTHGVARGFGSDEFERLRLDTHVPGGSGASDLFEADFNSLEHWQQQLTQGPNMMADLLNTTFFQNLMNDPDLLRDTMSSDPRLRDLIDQNPEIARVLSDPSTMQQTLEAATNPVLMREMMRNTDRAMSNIESSPEGFNMLRPMYENVQEPLLNATSMAEESGNDMASNPTAALFGGQGRGQVQDQSTNPAPTGSDTNTGSAPPNSNPLLNPWSEIGVPLEELYATQLTQLQDMGFIDTSANIQALQATSGNVHAAVEQLLGNFGR